MKSIKKLKKYGTAIAGSALLVGATLTGAAAQSGSSGDLGDYPAPFVDDDGNVQSSIVVGDDAATADVVGAIDIAGSLSQAAYTSEEVDTADGVSTSVDGDTFDELTVGTTVSESVDASDASYFARDTVENDDGEEVFVSESAMLTDSGDFNTRVNGTTTDLGVTKGSVVYEASFSPGFAVNDTIPMLGEEFEFTNRVDNSEIDLGSTESESGLSVGDSYEHGPYTVTVEGGNSNDGQILVNVMMDGDQVDSGQLGAGESLDVSDNFDLTARTVFYDSGSESWSIALESTYTDTTLEEGEAFPLDDRYTVEDINQRDVSGTFHVTSIKLSNNFASTQNPEDEDEVGFYDVGESVEGPADYFQVQNDGLTNPATEDVEFASGHEVTFMDPNAQETTVDVKELRTDTAGAVGSAHGDQINSTKGTGSPVVEDEYFAVEGNQGEDNYLVEATDVSTDGSGNVNSVTLAHNDFEQTFEEGGTTSVNTGYGFSLSLTFNTGGDAAADIDTTTTDTVTTQNGASLSGVVGQANNIGSTGDEYYVSVTESGDSENETVNIAYEASGLEDFSNADNGDVAGYYFMSGNNGEDNRGDVSSTDTSDGDSTLTDHGSALELTSSNTATLTHVEEQRYSAVSMGDVDASGDMSGGDTTMSMSPTYGDTFPSMGALDTAENIGQVKENDNVIVVGGPAINDLTAELADENQTWDANEWQTGGHEGESVLQMVDGWNEDQSALVVAGHSAEDTTTAADFLANYGDHSEALSGTDQVTISTETGNVVQ